MLKRLAILALFISSLAAQADAPVIWSGTTAKWLPPALQVAGMCKTDAAGVVTQYTTNGIIKMSSGVPGAAVSGTDYEVPLTFSTGLTRSVNTVTVNTSQNIATLSNLTTNGFLRAGGGAGTLSSAELSGDCTTSGSAAITCTKTNGSSFVASATTDTTNAANISSGLLGLARGGTNANLSATGGTSQVLKQVTSGAAVTVGQLACSDLSNAAASCSTDATNASNISSGTLGASRLPNPSSTTLGGIQSYAAVSNQWINAISTSGVPSSTQPACGNLSNAAASCSTDATNATNISSGTLAVARGGTGASLSATGGASQVLKQTSVGGAVTVAQLACSDLSGVATSCSTDTTNATNITSGTLSASVVPAPTTNAVASTSIDWSALRKTGGVYTKTLAANTTFTFANMNAGQNIIVRLTNSASNWTVTWPQASGNTVLWSGSTVPTQTTGAKVDVWTFIYDGVNIYGSVLQDFRP